MITSTVYPGQIFTDSINVNFGDSDPEHPFDHYELVFSSHSERREGQRDGEEGEEGQHGNGSDSREVLRRLDKNDP